jgi:hypothetical protein
MFCRPVGFSCCGLAPIITDNMALLAQKFEPFGWMARARDETRFKTRENPFIAC